MEDNELDIKFKEKIASIENEMSGYVSIFEDTNKDDSLSNSFSMYLREIGKYPLLTPEEEKAYAKIIQEGENNRLLSIKEVNNLKIYSLNTDLLFISLVNSRMYNTVIDSIINLFSRISGREVQAEEDIVKYKKISSKLSRSLNITELKKYFNVDDKMESIKEVDLLNYVKDYISFRYAFDRFYVSNLRLVVNIAKGYFRKNMDNLEIISEGNIGLLKAIQRFNPNFENRFATYASYWINESVQRFFYKNESAVRIPEHLIQETKKFKREVDELNKKEGRELTIDEISEKLNISMEKINEYYQNMFKVISLDKPLDEDNDYTLIDEISCDDSIDDVVESSALKDEIQPLLDCLNAREKKVIMLRFGFINNEEVSIQEVAKKLSLSPARIRQITAKALIKMRKVSNKESLNSLKYYIK